MPHKYSTRNGKYWICGYCDEKWNVKERCRKCNTPFSNAKLLEDQVRHEQAGADYQRKKHEEPDYRSTFLEYLAENDITFSDSMDDPDDSGDVEMKTEGDEPASSSQAGADIPSSSKGKAKITKREEFVEELNQPDSFINKFVHPDLL
eukprot:6578096-Karenia_brevis.AAC.1